MKTWLLLESSIELRPCAQLKSLVGHCVNFLATLNFYLCVTTKHWFSILLPDHNTLQLASLQ